MRIKLSIIACAMAFQAIAQSNTGLSASEIFNSLLKLNTVGSVLYIAAHPDDENTRLLSYLANERKLRTAYLSITRGDGGQNLIGKEQSEALGLIRTQELLAARRVDGAEQFFTRANDFGYSKTPEETLTIWNKDSVLADMVWTIRNFKPDVIICRFPTTGEGGHGHHTASAMLAEQAFDAAANANMFREQLQYVSVWQCKRLFWNTFNFGGTNTTADDQLKIDVGVFNPLLGKSYGEIAAESRSNHKSQGFGSAKQRGSSIEYFKQLKGDKVTTDLFEGIETSWKRLPNTSQLQNQLDNCIRNYALQKPEYSVKALTFIYNTLLGLDKTNAETNYWREQKLKACEKLILDCAGIWCEAASAEYTAIAGNSITYTVQAVNRSSANVSINSIYFLNNVDTTFGKALTGNQLFSYKKQQVLNETIPASNPYWLNQAHSNGLYSVATQSQIGKAQNDAALSVLISFDIEGLNLQVKRDIVYKSTDPVKGEVYRPLEVLPAVSINFTEKVIVFTDSKPKLVQLKTKANKANMDGTLKLIAAKGFSIKLAYDKIKLNNKGDELLIDAELSADASATNATLQASIIADNKTYQQSINRIEYDHIPFQFILGNAEIKLIRIDLKHTINNIGYIVGAGDEVPNCLTQAGYNVTLLTDEMLSKDDLSKYKAIVTGIRAYNTNERLQMQYSKLMDYIKQGGNLIVQYNTNNRIGPVVAKISPYPLNISRDRVTNENAKVEFVNQNLSVLNSPNKITNQDFDNWIQERGIYFANDISTDYQTVLRMNDPNEKPSEGSLLIAKYGKGNFVYTGLAFFRELPAGVPGAYRLFANLLELKN
jgi:LmbE family N-acetylglucosaminyl deacetylase